ncbi:MAG: hypothetical protein ABSE70_05465 [Candidatus Limnocylindrales bacterium]
MAKSKRPAPSAGSRLRPIEGRDLDDLEPIGYEDSVYDDDPDHREEGYTASSGDRIRDWIGRQLVRVGWLVLAAGLAFGSAGVAAATQRLPTGDNRPELTWAADKELSSKLDAAVSDLVLLNDDVDLLAQMARKTLSGLAQINQVALTQAWDSGSGAVDSIYARAADLNTRLKCDSLDAARRLEMGKTYSPALVDRYQRICLVVASIAPLRNDWESLVAGSRTAMRVASDIDDHDRIAVEALQLATKGLYPEALTKLSGASAAIADATSIAADLAKVTDVSTLRDWLTRTAGWDASARVLWQSLIDSKGRITPQVTAALKGEADARALLPDDNSVLQVVLYELAGNLTSDGISIEAARGALSDALGGLVGGTVVGQ